MTASLDIIIVNWNSGQHLRNCLDSIPAASSKSIRLQRVVVVDNSSWDRSAEGLSCGEVPLRVIRNELNRGFAAGCNEGARDSRADYLLFLNPDVLLRAESLSIPIQFMEQARNQRVGICGIQLLDPQGRLTRSCSRFPTPWTFYARMFGCDRLFPRRFSGHFLTEQDHRESKTVDQVMGAFFLVRRAAFEALGGFDERFFVYFEELDFSCRAVQEGWVSFYLASAKAHHAGGGCSNQVKAARLFYSLRSRILYGYKHFGWLAATGVLIGTLLVEPFSRLAWAAWRGSIREIGETLRAYAMLWRVLPTVVFNDGVASRHQDVISRPLRSRTTD